MSLAEIGLYILGVLLFIFGLAASIALHECGHMIPAKRFGVRVPQFFVGFGKTIWSRTRGETEYGIKAIPLGGYVKLIGMLPPEKAEAARPRRFAAMIADARAAEEELIRPGDEGRLFYQLKTWQKIVVMAGGPMVNLLIAFVLLVGLFGIHGAVIDKPVVSHVSDCVIAVTQAELATGKQRECKPTDPISPARKAGLKVGDQIVSFNGTEITTWDELTELITGNADGRAVLVVMRDGKRQTLTTNTTVSARPVDRTSDEISEVGFLGVSPTLALERQSPVYAAKEMVSMTWGTVQALGRMPVKLWGVARTALGLQERDPNGPMSVVGASRVAGEIASTDKIGTGDKGAMLVSLLAGLNLFLGMFNFVPLLPLDGGHIAGAIYEGLKRRLARLFGRPDPGHADVARMLPVAYVVAGAFVVMTLLLVYVDLVHPVSLQ